MYPRQAVLLLLPALGAAILSQDLRRAVGEDRTQRSQDRTAEKDVYEAQASYDYPHYYHGEGYHHHHISHVNDDAVKGLLVPLAGIALLGAAAIAASNPVLLQIGVVGGSIGKRRRRRRAIPRIEDLKVLEKFLEQIPKPTVVAEEKKLQASYLQCSGLGDKSNRCFERVTCEIGKPGSNSTLFEKQVLDIVISDVMMNEFLPPEMKHRIQEAHKIGLNFGDCSKYYCREIETRFSY